MDTVKSELANFLTAKDLKAVLAADGPCLSVYLPLSKASKEGKNPKAKQNELQWKECLRQIKDRAAQFGPVGEELVKSVAAWDVVAPESVNGGSVSETSLAVFRSRELFRVALLDSTIASRAVMGPHFYIRPLLAELVKDRRFYLLALSQKNTRLLFCTMHSAEEVSFPPDTKTNFDVWMDQVKPDHRAVDNAMTAPVRGGAGPNALAPKGADDEAKDEYLAHYCKQVDRGVNEVLKGKTEPLVVCAVEYEVSIYREVNHYPHLAPEEVRGAPNSLKAGEMHSRAIQALERVYEKKVESALAEWNHRVGGGASSRLKDVVTAAHDGRVLTLFASESLEQTGVFDETTHTVKGRETGSPADEDLVNDAAVQTILHAGEVLVVPQNAMPNGSPVAATFRY